MKLKRRSTEQKNAAQIDAHYPTRDDDVVALADLDGVPSDITGLLAARRDVAEQVNRPAARVRQRTPLSEVTLGAPISRPSRYLAIAFNYASHLAEIREAANQPRYAEQMQRFGHLRQAFRDQTLPTFFNKQVSCITGYAVGNDVSVRYWQQNTPTMWPAKSFDTHGPLGPWIITADDLDPGTSNCAPWGPVTWWRPAHREVWASSPDDCYNQVSGCESKSKASAPSRTPSLPSLPRRRRTTDK
jgi:2-keto-4-pentenoate hydratase/2-oxohepta-3-ene-1,7-dioic acid hydratase in catechol pathway